MPAVARASARRQPAPRRRPQRHASRVERGRRLPAGRPRRRRGSGTWSSRPQVTSVRCSARRQPRAISVVLARRSARCCGRTGSPPGRRRPCPVLRAGEHEVLLDGQQQLPPCADRPRCRSRTGRCRVVQRQGALRRFLFPSGQALADEAAAFQGHAHERRRDREGVGQVLEVVRHVHRPARRRAVQEVHVVNYAKPHITGKNRIGGPGCRVPRRCPGRPGRPKNRHGVALNDRLVVEEVRHTCATGIRSCPPPQ